IPLRPEETAEHVHWRRECGLGPDDEACAEMRPRQVAIQLERRFELRLVPFHLLRNRALHDRDCDRLARRLRPFMSPEREAENPDRDDGARCSNTRTRAA